MAWVEKVNKTKRHAWRVGYRGPDRRERYRTLTRKADADLFAATVETAREETPVTVITANSMPSQSRQVLTLAAIPPGPGR